MGGPETLGDFGPHGPHSARNSLAERSLPSAAGTVLGPASWSDARKDGEEMVGEATCRRCGLPALYIRGWGFRLPSWGHLSRPST